MSHQSFPKAVGSITDGYVLTYVGSDGYWKPKAPPTGGWQTVYEVDFSALTTQSFVGNGTVTIDGKSWTVENFAAATSFGIVNGTGLQFVCNTSNTDYNNSTRNGLLIGTKITNLYPQFSLTNHKVRVTGRVASSNADQNSEFLVFGLEDSDSPTSLNYTLFKGYQNGAMLAQKATIAASSNAFLDTTNTSDDVLQVTLDLPTNAFMNTGVYSSGFPTQDNMRPRRVFMRSGDFTPSVSNSQDVNIVISAITNNTNGNLTVVVDKVKVEIFIPSSASTLVVGGDLSGTLPNPTVAKIQGRNISTTPPTDGYVLTWDNLNSQWKPKEPVGAVDPAKSSWQTALDLDLTAQGTQTLSSDTSYSIGGISFTKINSANEATAATLDSNGLTFQPNSSTDYNGATRTLPSVFALLKNIIPNFDLGMDVRLTVYNSSLNNTANYDNSVIAIDTNSTTFGVVLKRGHGTTGQVFQSFLNRSATNVSGFISSGSAPSSTNDTMIIEIPAIGSFSGYKTYDGDYNNGFPLATAFNPHKSYLVSAGTQNTDNLTVNNLGILLGAQRAGSGTALVVRYARLKVEYRGGSATVPDITAVSWLSTKTSNYTVTDLDTYIPVDTTSNAVTITLPASPKNGQRYVIADVGGVTATNNIIVDGNGHNIVGLSTYIITGPYNVLEVAYHTGKAIWVVI